MSSTALTLNELTIGLLNIGAMTLFAGRQSDLSRTIIFWAARNRHYHLITSISLSNSAKVGAGSKPVRGPSG